MRDWRDWSSDVCSSDLLAQALAEGVIAGAALDVFEREPEVHPGLLDSDRVVIVPHLGSATIETRTAMAELAARNALAVLSDAVPPTPVNSVPPAGAAAAAKRPA